MNIEKNYHGNFKDKDVNTYTLTNDNNMVVVISELGGRILNLIVPNDKGETKDVVLGYDKIEQYGVPRSYYGALVGRVANRIRGASYTLNGKTYTLNTNDGDGNTLHGGLDGYSRRIWETKVAEASKDCATLSLSLFDPDGEQGFGGNVNVTATYTLGNDNALKIEMIATTDLATPMAFTGHSYFNLNGHDSGKNTSNHTLKICSETRLDKDDSIPNGNTSSVLNTYFDFSKPRVLKESYEELNAMDISYIAPKTDGKVVEMAVVSADGRTMTVSSNEKIIHFYNGVALKDDQGKEGIVYQKFDGLCLEPKGYVNSINIDSFPSDVLEPGETYNHTIIYAFS